MGGVSHSVLLFSPLISDKMFPALGFGAQLPPDWKVSEAGCFLLAEVCDLSEIHFGKIWGRDPVALPSLSFPKTTLISPPEPHAGPGSPNEQDSYGLCPPPPPTWSAGHFGEGAGSCETKAGFLGRHHDARGDEGRGGGRAGSARPSMSWLLGHQPAFKELWLNEMFSCAKASLEMSQGNSREARAWPGWRARQCPEGCCSAQAGRGQMLCLPPLPGPAPRGPFPSLLILTHLASAA